MAFKISFSKKNRNTFQFVTEVGDNKIIKAKLLANTD